MLITVHSGITSLNRGDIKKTASSRSGDGTVLGGANTDSPV